MPDDKTTCLKKIVCNMKKAIEHKAYKMVLVGFILASCYVLISLHPHVNRGSEAGTAYLIVDKIVKSFFLLDLVFNLLVYGLFENETAYLRRSHLSWVNIIIILLEIISFSQLGHN